MCPILAVESRSNTLSVTALRSGPRTRHWCCADWNRSILSDRGGGRMRLNPYLSFNGQCEAAFRFYEKCLGGKITFMMTYGESPMAAQAPPGWGKKIVHATLTVDNCMLQGADVTPERYEKPQGFSVN